MEKYKVSIIIPSYKPLDYLWDCLNSFYNQTFPFEHFEVILVLNGCNEPYQAKIVEWLSSHPGMNVTFHQTDISGVFQVERLLCHFLRFLQEVSGESHQIGIYNRGGKAFRVIA